MLMQRLGINANYLTEVIRRSGYGSFYDMICQHCVRHAITLILEAQVIEKADGCVKFCGYYSAFDIDTTATNKGGF